MLLSPIKQTKTDISAHSRSLIPVSILKVKREPEIQVIMPLLFSMPKDSKIYQLFTESEILLEFTELPWDYITTKDNSMLTFSTTLHGLCSQQTRNQPCKKLETKMQETRTHPSHSQESTTLLRSTKLPSSQTLESGLSNISHNTTWSHQTCLSPWTKLQHKKEILMLSLRFLKFLN